MGTPSLKPGQLAVIIYSVRPENIGAIVRCLKYVPQGKFWDAPDDKLHIATSGPAWAVESMGRMLLCTHSDDTTALAPTMFKIHGVEWLRPLVDTDGDDESLTWAGKPPAVERTAPATPSTTAAPAALTPAKEIL